jgi:aspartate/methionine/tyrosine aminotransferase
VGFKVYEPQGSFFVMADFTPFGFDDDVAFSRHLIEKVGVAAIPPSGFYT